MSMPVITGSNIHRCDAITDIIQSVALQQTGLSHILNAEGEKIQAVLAISKDTNDLLAVNESVESMVNAITKLEVMLQSKLSLFKDCICTTCEKIAVELTLGNPDDGSLVKIDDKTYNFTFGEKENKIIFNTLPVSTVTLLSSLPDGVTFENGVLYVEGLKVNTTLEFLIGDEASGCIVTINLIA